MEKIKIILLKIWKASLASELEFLIMFYLGFG